MATEKRLIDANAIEYPDYFYEDEAHPDPFIEGYRQGKIDAICDIRALTPTVDAVPVVRCKDCKHWDKDALWCNINSHQGGEQHYNWYADDFCSYGERKEQ